MALAPDVTLDGLALRLSLQGDQVTAVVLDAVGHSLPPWLGSRLEYVAAASCPVQVDAVVG